MSKRFYKNVEHVIENYGASNFGEDELLLDTHVLQQLCIEAAKLKISSAMGMVATDTLVKLLNALDITIRGADRMTPIMDKHNDSKQFETTMDRVMSAADASLTCLYILTSRNIPKHVYIEDIIDGIVLYIKYQMYNTIFPSYDVSYRLDNKKEGKQKKSMLALEKSIQTLYNKISEMVTLLSDLLEFQILTDTSVLHTSSMGISPFFTENVNELQLSCLKLVTTIFTKYENHRRLLLDDILESIARLPSTKRSLRSYKLFKSDENIQMLTALVLQLIQCVAVLPENLYSSKKEWKEDRLNANSLKNDVLICTKSRQAISTAETFLCAFLNKVGKKTEDIDYRHLFENFVEDLLATLNKPEWPATELVLDLLGKLLVSKFTNKGTNMSLRLASLDYFGVIVAARLRKSSAFSKYKLKIDQMIEELKLKEIKQNDEEVNKQKLKVNNEEERMQFLQGILLDFFTSNVQDDEVYRFARYFYIVQWYNICNTEKTSICKNENVGKHNSKDKSNERRISQRLLNQLSGINDDTDFESVEVIENQHNDKIKDLDKRMKFLISKTRPFKENGKRIRVFENYIDYNSAELIAQYLASKCHFSQCFDRYLKAILIVLKESSCVIRRKAMKCLTMFVEADPSVFSSRHNIEMIVNFLILDRSTSMREAAVDLIGKCVLKQPELINKYYEMLSARILDTGISVRKRVIKILKNICIQCPEFPKIPEICIKMIRRLNDEKGICKLVIEVFQNMWFTPSTNDNSLLRKVMNITDVVTSCKDIELEWFEKLLLSLFKTKENNTKIVSEPPKALLLACQQIIGCLIENVLKFEETSDNGGTSDRLIAFLTTLYLFSNSRPYLLVEHATTLEPYLSWKCETNEEFVAIMLVTKIMEKVVPLIKHPSDSFVAQLEEDNIMLILNRSDRRLVNSSMSCLGTVINQVTRNFKLIRDCFTRYYLYLKRFQNWLQNSEQYQFLLREVKCRKYFRRSVFIVGLILKYFDFENVEVAGDKLPDIQNKIYNMFIYFLQQDDVDIQVNTLNAMGFICIRYYKFMLKNELKCFYHRMLTLEEVPLQIKSRVLCNIESYLIEKESRMIQKDLEWTKRSKDKNLKEMGDVSSGMAGTIIQLYLKEILHTYLHPDIQIRIPASKLIQLVLQQELVNPDQIIPYIICMSTDEKLLISHAADKHLQEIEIKYPGFIHAKSSLGISLSYELQGMLQEVSIVRGFKITEEGKYPRALNANLYSHLRSSIQQRRSLVLNILKQFDDQTQASLSFQLYLADNLAYFPYQVQDEPLFIVHYMDLLISVSGTNILQTFEDLLITDAQKITNNIYTSDEDEEDTLVEQLPEDVSQLQACIMAAHGCLLLLVLKQHIKDTYDLNDSKIQKYSPTKLYEKRVNRKSNAYFNPEATMNRIKQDILPDFAGRKELIKQYLDFKQLMLQMDLDNNKNQKKASTTYGSSYKDKSKPKVQKLRNSERSANRRRDSDAKQNAKKKRKTKES